MSLNQNVLIGMLLGTLITTVFGCKTKPVELDQSQEISAGPITCTNGSVDDIEIVSAVLTGSGGPGSPRVAEVTLNFSETLFGSVVYCGVVPGSNIADPNPSEIFTWIVVDPDNPQLNLSVNYNCNNSATGIPTTFLICTTTCEQSDLPEIFDLQPMEQISGNTCAP